MRVIWQLQLYPGPLLDRKIELISVTLGYICRRTIIGYGGPFHNVQTLHDDKYGLNKHKQIILEPNVDTLTSAVAIS
jgi:hypothetical protein